MGREELLEKCQKLKSLISEFINNPAYSKEEPYYSIQLEYLRLELTNVGRELIHLDTIWG